MASSSVEMPRRIGKKASIPFLLHSVASFVTLPAKAAKAGDYVAVQRILGPFLQSPEANALFGGRP